MALFCCAGQFECRLCLTLHTNEGSYLSHTQGKKHQTNLSRRLAKEKADAVVAPMPLKVCWSGGAVAEVAASRTPAVIVPFGAGIRRCVCFVVVALSVATASANEFVAVAIPASVTAALSTIGDVSYPTQRLLLLKCCWWCCRHPVALGVHQTECALDVRDTA